LWHCQRARGGPLGCTHSYQGQSCPRQCRRGSALQAITTELNDELNDDIERVVERGPSGLQLIQCIHGPRCDRPGVWMSIAAAGAARSVRRHERAQGAESFETTASRWATLDLLAHQFNALRRLSICPESFGSLTAGASLRLMNNPVAGPSITLVLAWPSSGGDYRSLMQTHAGAPVPL